MLALVFFVNVPLHCETQKVMTEETAYERSLEAMEE